MALRTNEELVRGVITVNPDIEIAPHINTANALTDWLASRDGDGVLTPSLLESIETYLAAHFYALRDPQAQQEKTLDASATWQGQTGQGLRGTWWGQQAIELDISNNLGRKRVGAEWLGKPPSEQIDYVDRD